jgi:hypothetical protein
MVLQTVDPEILHESPGLTRHAVSRCLPPQMQSGIAFPKQGLIENDADGAYWIAVASLCFA